MESYEKKYKDALGWMQSVYQTMTGADKEDAEHFFPELKESEGEKIRKVLVGWFKSYKEEDTCGSEMFNGIPTDNILTWLEKQGQVKESSISQHENKTCKENSNSLTGEDEKIREVLIHIVKNACSKFGITYKYQGVEVGEEELLAWLEKQGEWKSAEFKPSFRVGDVIKPKDPVLGEPRIIKGIHPKFGYDTNNGILDFEFEDNWELVEQKLADKLEPKFKVKYAGCEYNVLEVKDIAGVTYYGIEDEPNHIDYVKADNCKIISGGYGIKENGSPYPTKTAVFSEQKPAWSEEDKQHIDSLLKRLDGLCRNEFERTRFAISEDKDWLKSLKQRIG